MAATTDYLNGSLEDISKADLTKVLKKIEDELKGHRTAKDLVGELRMACSNIEYGDDWKNGKTSDARLLMLFSTERTWVRKLSGQWRSNFCSR